MTELLHELLSHSADAGPTSIALRHRGVQIAYQTLQHEVMAAASGLLTLGVAKLERIGTYLPKSTEAVASYFAASRAGMAFVPINPLLKPAQVEHILRDCNIRVLVTSADRAESLREILGNCPDLRAIVTIDAELPNDAAPRTVKLTWQELTGAAARSDFHRVIDTDMVSIFYTSGSTGKPKGVVLSHRNMVAGAHSVADYLQNCRDDRILAVLPFSFDYGFSQLSTALLRGAQVILLDYLLPRDVLNTATREGATGLAGVPPLWMQLAELSWPPEIASSLRYITNSGGTMPKTTLARLRAALPNVQVYLMYGLTEAFRSSYLPPCEVDRRPDSIGKAIPNAELLVVRPDGTPCNVDEPGELVHRGSLVSLGYWNDAGKTTERFRPLPGQNPALILTETAVWSGDTVRRDEEGFLYFVGRRDEMIKTSGYRVSPTEVEEAVYATGLVSDAVAVGVPHPLLGQAVAIVASAAPGTSGDSAALIESCKRRLPMYMIPHSVHWRQELPRNPNGKFDRARLASELKAQLAAGDS